MNAQEPEGPQTEKDVESSQGGSGELPKGMDVGPGGSPAKDAGPSTGSETVSGGGESHSGQTAGASGVDASKLQHAMENLARRIAEARARGASGARADFRAQYRPQGVPGGAPAAPLPEPHRVESGVEEKPERRMTALELRMRQIADLAGAPIAEDMGADIAAIRGKMDRLSRADGVLSNRMETMQRQLSYLRDSVDSSTAVVERLVELETRLEEIGEALANRHLSVEARAAVEHSCSHILGAVARIEGLTRQALVPESVWDQIASVRAKVDRLPTEEKIAIEQRIREVSEKLGAVAERSDQSQGFTSLETRLSEIGAATKAALEEIRERPAYDPADIRALRERIDTWRAEEISSESPAVGTKLEAIARQVDQLKSRERTVTLSKIQDDLRRLTGIVSAQSASLSGLDLAGLQDRLASICDELASGRDGPAGETGAKVAPSPSGSRFSQGLEDGEDHQLAKRLAVPLAPEAVPPGGGSRGRDAADDLSGAFDAVQTALEALVGQIPLIERPWDTAAQSTAPGEDSAPSSREAAGQDRPDASELLRWRARSTTGKGAPAASHAPPADVSSALAGSADRAADRLEHGSAAVGAEARRSTEDAASADTPASYADAAHCIGRYSTWRKAKVAVVAANPPKY